MQHNSHYLNRQTCAAPLVLARPDRAVKKALAVLAHGKDLSRCRAGRQKAHVSVRFVRDVRSLAVWEERTWLVLACAGLATLVLSLWLS